MLGTLQKTQGGVHANAMNQTTLFKHLIQFTEYSSTCAVVNGSVSDHTVSDDH